MADTQTVTSTRFQQAVGEYGDQARKNPIIVTRHQRPWFVVVSPEEYERLMSYDTRKALYPHELSDDLAKELESAAMDPRHAHLDRLMD